MLKYLKKLLRSKLILGCIIRLYNFCRNWVQITHFPKRNIFSKLTVTIVYVPYSFMLEHLAQIGCKLLPQKGIFRKVNQDCFGLSIAYNDVMSFQKYRHRIDHENNIA